MEKPTIRIYQEIKPKHYVGPDVSLTLSYKCEKWEVDLIENAIVGVLEGVNHEVSSYYKQSLKESQ